MPHVRGIVHKGSKMNRVILRKVRKQVEGADFLSLVQRIGDAMTEEKDIHDSPVRCGMKISSIRRQRKPSSSRRRRGCILWRFR